MTGIEGAIRSAFGALAPNATWRGIPTGWHALDLWALGEVVQVLQPSMVVLDGIGKGGLAMYVGDLLDLNHRGRVQAWESMELAKARRMHGHRRIQWMPLDLAKDKTLPILASLAPGLLVLVAGSDASAAVLSGCATPGSYLVQPLDTSITAVFDEDLNRDPLGVSAHRWLVRREP